MHKATFYINKPVHIHTFIHKYIHTDLASRHPQSAGYQSLRNELANHPSPGTAHKSRHRRRASLLETPRWSRSSATPYHRSGKQGEALYWDCLSGSHILQSKSSLIFTCMTKGQLQKAFLGIPFHFLVRMQDYFNPLFWRSILPSVTKMQQSLRLFPGSFAPCH